MIDSDDVRAALEEVSALVRADGGDLALSHIDGSVAHLRLLLETAECRECVMPGPFLEQVALDMLSKTVDGLTGVVVDDPR